ncbi:oligoribonuclease isoform X1 [Populus alba]|uniref:oligoribonuclease isoform X1 n=1 Tax=Populus alba TaxID=43335 RepID=UPI00158AE89D|nr:oligoribonuclease isoform X1 [Populus alba]
MKESSTCLPSAFKFAVAAKKIKMNLLSNAFSLLELDAEDDRVNIASSSKSKSSNNKGKSKKKVNESNLVVKKEKQNEENLVTSSSEVYKMPLVWIDLEMTVFLVAGLNAEVDRILEIACIITDGYLTKSVEGPDLVIHQSKECLDRMGEWCQSHHAASGLTNKVLGSKITESEAEKQVIGFVKRHVGGTHTPLLAGNSVYVDFLFLKKYMPDLAGLFSHVVVDVSSVKALCIRWYPKGNISSNCNRNTRIEKHKILKLSNMAKHNHENGSSVPLHDYAARQDFGPTIHIGTPTMSIVATKSEMQGPSIDCSNRILG